MIDAVGAVVLAYDYEGEPVHARRRCVGAKPWDRARRRMKQARYFGERRAFVDSLEADGFTELTRYAMQVYENEVVGDMEESPSAYGLTGNEGEDELRDAAQELCTTCFEPFDVWPVSDGGSET